MRLLLLIIILAMALPAAAQTPSPTPTPRNTPRPGYGPDCGNGLPCGPIPWPLPVYGYIPSPTIFPTIVVTATRTPTPIPGVTAGPTSAPGASPTFELDGVGDQLATLEKIMNATTVPIDGEAFDAEQLGTDAGSFFGTLKGVSQLHLGPFTPLIVFVFAAFLFVMGIQASGLIVPLVLSIFGFIRRMVSTILDFLPL